MKATTQFLVEETNAKIGYTQSDEISLIWLQENFENEIFFDSKLLKMTSILASLATAFFNRYLPEYLPEKTKQMPVFDARVWNVPTEAEAVNYLIWRELDATRNSVSMAAQSMFSHKQLHGKSSSIMQDMMFDKFKVNWNDYPSFFKRGTYFQRKEVVRPFSCDELSKLHPKHDAHTNPDLDVVRSEVVLLELPPITQIENRRDVFFKGSEFSTKTQGKFA